MLHISIFMPQVLCFEFLTSKGMRRRILHSLLLSIEQTLDVSKPYLVEEGMHLVVAPRSGGAQCLPRPGLRCKFRGEQQRS